MDATKSAKVTHFPIHGSDHSPILIESNPQEGLSIRIAIISLLGRLTIRLVLPLSIDRNSGAGFDLFGVDRGRSQTNGLVSPSF